MSESPVQQNLNPKERLPDRNNVDWKKIKELSNKFIERSAITVAIFLTLVALVSPQLLAHTQKFDETFCSLNSVVLEDAETTTISCTNTQGESIELSLGFLIKNYNVGVYTEDHVTHPPFFTSEFASNINNPNYNCHSRTMQLIQESSGVDFGAGIDRWLETGLDVFMREFGTEVSRLDAIPNEFGEDVIDISGTVQGDVVLFFDHSGKLIHSATVGEPKTTEDGTTYLQIINKLGESGELNSSIDDMVRLYELWGEYDDSIGVGGGSIVVYRPNIQLLQTAFAGENQ